jgi:glycine cleavage system H protein
MGQADMKYSQTHEWARIEGDIVTAGITDFAAQQLSDLVYLDLPKVGTQVKQGEPFGEVESVKAVSDINAPVSGEVTEINEKAASNLNLVTTASMTDGWLVKIKMTNPAELNKLVSADDYEKLKGSDH